MKSTFVRALVVIAVIQFVVTRTMAGRATEEGSAERMWLMYPLNVLLNAIAWTLLIRAFSRVISAVRRAS